MNIPQITNVLLQKTNPVLAGTSVVTLIVTAIENQIEKAYLYDNSSNQIIDSNSNIVFSRNLEDNYYSQYSGLEIDNFVTEVI